VSRPTAHQAKAREIATRISEDIARLETVNAKITESLKLLKSKNKYKPHEFDRFVTATAAELQDFYTGIEVVLEKIVKFKTGQVPDGKSSHQALLGLAKDQKIIDETQHAFLRRLSALRHFVRHAYGKELNSETVKDGAGQTIDQWPDIKAAIIRQQTDIHSPY
jgi:hypothetical protein